MKSTRQKKHWLDAAEMAAVVCSLGGAVTSILLKQFLWVTIPLSVSTGLAVVNHQRLKKLVESEKEAVAFLIQENHARISKLKQQSEKNHWDSKVNIAELKKTGDSAMTELERLDQEQKSGLKSTAQELQTLQTSVAKLDQLAQKLEQEQNETRKLAKELKAIEKFTQMIDKNGEAAQPYYLRGSAYQRSGNIERAIEDLTKAIELRKDHGKAYHKRGLLYVEVDEPQKAIIDLRRASQYYIGKGDLDKYRETRDLSLKLHFNQSAAAETIPSDSQPKSEAVAVGNLFG